MPDTLNEQVVDQITALNFKNLGELHSLTGGLSGQNQLALQQRVSDAAAAVHSNAMNAAQQIAQLAGQSALSMHEKSEMLAQAMMGRVARTVLDTSAEQATAFSREIASDLSNRMNELGAILASIQQDAKIANTTSPQTGGASGWDNGGALSAQLASIEALLRAQSQRNT